MNRASNNNSLLSWHFLFRRGFYEFYSEINYVKKCSLCSAGYLLTKEGIKPEVNKVQAVIDLQPPTTLKQLRSLLGMVQFYRDMWQRRSHIPTPPTDLVGKFKKKLAWADIHQKAFDEIKAVMAKETILNYPDFSKVFEIQPY